MRCEINKEDIVHECLDGEVVIVNLKNGRYYSLVETASQVWSGIVSGSCSWQIERELRQQFCDPEALISPSLSGFLREMEEEGLLRLVAQDPPDLPAPTCSEAEAPPYRPPVLNKHTDMESLLLLDPIHDVSEQGWPERKAGEP